MIDYIKYKIDGATYSLTNNGDNTWIREETAPRVAGNYLLTLIISENGIVTTINSSNSLYETYLNEIIEAESVAYLEKYVPDFMAETKQFKTIFDIENENFNNLYYQIEKIKSDAFITTASNDAIVRLEKSMSIKGLGTLNQRKSYLISMLQKGNKLSENSIKNITNAITGSNCIVTFFGSDESSNPVPGYGLLRVQVLSPDNSKDYRYEDIFRALKPLVPGHIQLLVIKYFSIWTDINNNLADWNAVASMNDWESVKNYIPTQ